MARAVRKIDTDKVNFNYKHTHNYSVEYYVYKARDGRVIDMPAPEKRGKAITGVCFSDLLRTIRSRPGRYNRVLYTMCDDGNNIKLTIIEKEKWINMARKNKFLPRYVRSTCATESGGNLVLKLNDIQPSLLYLYLTVFRHIRDDPGLVKCMIHLVDECKMDFYLAYTVSCRLCVTNSGHSIMGYTKRYMEKGDINKLNVNVSYALALNKFINNVKQYTNGTVKSCKGSYGCSSTIEKARPEEYVVPVQCMLKPKFKKAMRTYDLNKIKRVCENNGRGR